MNRIHRQMTRIAGASCAVLLMAGVCFAQGGRVTFSDGQPAVGAKVHIDLDGVEKFKVVTDAAGRFELPAMEFLDAMVQIQAPDGKDFASVSLPVRLFETGNVAIVLQPKK
uniref:Carboxypeptidase regulatory-like domain-containing protein n=1 Tax=Geobacter metallireducens TaxID=28232 RepID=A0A831UEZ7_GEOME